MLQPAPDPDAFIDPQLAAAEARLRYSSDRQPGITRIRRGRSFGYRGPDGAPVRDTATLERIRALAIPPAWTDVWISPDPKGHLAATGYDVRGRKQYRYNSAFVAVRDAAKFEHILSFARVLPRLRRRVRRDMARSGLAREKVLATIVYLLEHTLTRIGNESYARDNHSFGLTTLRNRHVRVNGEELRFLFTGKGGKVFRHDVRSRRVARIVRACQELPGQTLFEYRDQDGTVQRVDSADVNTYLQQVTGQSITAKDFRTWFGTVEAAMAFDALAADGARPTKTNVRRAIRQAADRLGNTVAICRRCYVHPEVIGAYEEGALTLTPPQRATGLTGDEERVLAFPKRRLGGGRNRRRAHRR
jgi:DNA topoisomerase-1